MKFNITKIAVGLSGITPIMFARFPGSMDEQLPWAEKVYLSQGDGKTLIFPATNVMSFLSAQNTESAPKRIMGKKWRGVAQAALSYVNILPIEIPFLRKGEKLTLENSGIWKHDGKAIVKKGQLAIPSPKERPVLPVPWELVFQINLVDSQELTENILKNLFEMGGILIGFGTYRGVFGKFEVKEWKHTA